MQYTDTISKLARESEVTTVTVGTYAKLGFLEYVTQSNGVRLFRPGQAEKVREIFARRMASRGRRAAG